MNRLFVPVRDAELRANHWRFAMKRDSLIALSDAPAWGYDVQYALPADFISLVQVNDIYIKPYTKQQGLWSIEGSDSGRRILTNLTAPLKVRYIYQVTNAGLFDPLFTWSLACRLALEACEQITQSSAKKESIRQDYAAALAAAARANAIENPPDELPWGTWLDAREGATSVDLGVSQ